MSTVLDFSEVDALLDDLRRAPDAEPEPGPGLNADTDPASVRTPGVWVRHIGLSLDHLGGYTHKLQLHLVVPDTGYERSRNALVDLLNEVLTVVEPDDDPFFQGLVLPGNPKALPGLVIPLNLPDTYQE